MILSLYNSAATSGMVNLSCIMSQVFHQPHTCTVSIWDYVGRFMICYHSKFYMPDYDLLVNDSKLEDEYRCHFAIQFLVVLYEKPSVLLTCLNIEERSCLL
jgi:hypothetical protein